MRKRAWRRGRVLESKSENLGSHPGDVTFETIQFCRRSSTFVKVCRKSSIFIVKFSSGMSETFFDTCVNWSCVTRCGCRTTSSTLFTLQGEDKRPKIVFFRSHETSPIIWIDKPPPPPWLKPKHYEEHMNKFVHKKIFFSSFD